MLTGINVRKSCEMNLFPDEGVKTFRLISAGLQVFMAACEMALMLRFSSFVLQIATKHQSFICATSHGLSVDFSLT
jgi:hypothetical protein